MNERDVQSTVLAIQAGTHTADEIVGRLVARVSTHDPLLHAFAHFDANVIAEQAACVERIRRGGESLGSLAGLCVGIKDALCTVNQQTTAGSKVLDGFVPPYDAEVVRRLRLAGAIAFGKTNQDEFSMGSSTETSAFGSTHNPWDLDRTPGGSSGGSAAAVSAGMCPAALGSDTGGSIRQPAAFCGVFGIKPTYGRVSRRGLIAFASSLDQVGVLASNVDGGARVLEVIAGHDPRDMTSVSRDVPRWTESLSQLARGTRLGIPKEYFGPGLDPDVARLVQDAVAALEKGGSVLVPISLPTTSSAIACYYVLATAEASSNLSRYDGIRYGAREKAETLGELYEKTRNLFGAEVKRRILLGTFVLSSGYVEAYYEKARRAREAICDDFSQAFQHVDAILSPVTPTTAFQLGERINDPLAMYLSDAYTLPASLAGLPSASVPCGVSRNGMPVGLQLTCKAWDEQTVFQLAAAVERTVGCLVPEKFRT